MSSPAAVVSVNTVGLSPGVSVARVVQFVTSALICSVRVRHGVLEMTRVTRPSGVRSMERKLGVPGNAVGIAVMVLASKATWPFCANARPSSVAPVFSVIEVYASMFPLMIESTSRVAELPTCQKTWQAVAPPLRITLRSTVVINVVGIWKMKTAFGSPWASRVRSPDEISSEDVDVTGPLFSSQGLC